VGTVAYQIVDTNGCTPYDGLEYLERGARSRIFRIIQTVEYFYSGIVITGIMFASFGGSDSMGSRQRVLQVAAGLGLLVLWLPILAYEILLKNHRSQGFPLALARSISYTEVTAKYKPYHPNPTKPQFHNTSCARVVRQHTSTRIPDRPRRLSSASWPLTTQRKEL